MKKHDLKIDSTLYKSVRTGVKTAEVRKDDRNYQVGDILIFSPVDSLTKKSVSPDFCCREITHKLDGGKYGIERGYCLLSMTNL